MSKKKSVYDDDYSLVKTSKKKKNKSKSKVKVKKPKTKFNIESTNPIEHRLVENYPDLYTYKKTKEEKKDKALKHREKRLHLYKMRNLKRNDRFFDRIHKESERFEEDKKKEIKKVQKAYHSNKDSNLNLFDKFGKELYKELKKERFKEEPDSLYDSVFSPIYYSKIPLIEKLMDIPKIGFFGEMDYDDFSQFNANASFASKASQYAYMRKWSASNDEAAIGYSTKELVELAIMNQLGDSVRSIKIADDVYDDDFESDNNLMDYDSRNSLARHIVNL